MSNKIKAGDEVVVISGESRGHRGKVLRVIPAKQRVLVEGANLLTFTERAKSTQGGTQENKRVEREAPIHISNVMLAGRYDKRLESKQNA